MKKIKSNLKVILFFLIILLLGTLKSYATENFSIKGYIDSFKTGQEVNGNLKITRLGYE